MEDGEVRRAILTVSPVSRNIDQMTIKNTDLSIDLRKIGMSHCLKVLTCSKRDADIKV